ncbi:hypothetical protein MtrunA17_Chr2g0300551 [Medicago truncatula]|uniref:Uncharacterized protein n=1 Tax=Medicago truncatula TaxID=3880 RepID=A0A396J631_MEDTR|nr:hypothetical protein MtrunA17_Chr2g0300551 [Medicago truncatula]
MSCKISYQQTFDDKELVVRFLSLTIALNTIRRNNQRAATMLLRLLIVWKIICNILN